MDVMWSLAEVTLRGAVKLAIVDEAGLPAVMPTTAKWLRYAADRLARFLGEDRPVDRVVPLDVAAWVQSEEARGLKATSINSNLRALKTLYSRLQRAGVVSFNAAAPVRFLPELPPQPRAVDRSDYLAMRAVAGCARDRAILDVLWASGCRLGGLLSMRVDRMERWSDKNGRDCFALLVVEKFGKPRWTYVGREAQQAEGLAAWLDERPICEEPWLWTIRRRPFGRVAASTVQSVIRNCRLAAGIPKGRPCFAHAYRHSYSLRMLDDGEDMATVSAWLGHHSPEFTATVYARRSEQRLREKYFSH